MAAATTATSTYESFLMSSTDGTTYTKLLDITDYPDLGGDPETIDVTTLSHKMRVYVEGVQKTDALKFTAPYVLSTYTALKALAGTVGHYSVWFGGTESTGDALPTPTGDDGKFDFDGTLSVYVTSAKVNEARMISVSITPITEITLG